MATTTYFGWETPDDTDLVKDGAAAMRTLGSEIDTSMTDLLGGTTGQVLAKASDTDMDFVWSADAAGMANPMTTTGDTIYSSSGSTPARLGVGADGEVLTVAGGVPTWAAPAGGGKVLQVVYGSYATQVSSSSSTYADTGLTATITPSSASSQVLVLVTQNGIIRDNASSNSALNLKMLRGATDIQQIYSFALFTGVTETAFYVTTLAGNYLDSPATTSATTYKTQFASGNNNASVFVQKDSAVSSIVLLEIGA